MEHHLVFQTTVIINKNIQFLGVSLFIMLLISFLKISIYIVLGFKQNKEVLVFISL